MLDAARLPAQPQASPAIARAFGTLALAAAIGAGVMSAASVVGGKLDDHTLDLSLAAAMAPIESAYILPDPFAEHSFIGRWVAERPAGQGQGHLTVELALQGDGTFTRRLVATSGGKAREIESSGRWTVEEGVVCLTRQMSPQQQLLGDECYAAVSQPLADALNLRSADGRLIELHGATRQPAPQGDTRARLGQFVLWPQNLAEWVPMGGLALAILVSLPAMRGAVAAAQRRT